MHHLKANTAVKVVIGPFVDVTDGFTPETGVALSTADEAEIIKHDAASVTDISGATWAAITGADGYYNLSLTAALTDTEGMLTVIVQDDSVCLPVKAQFMVLSQAAYDSMYAAKDSGVMSVDATAISGDTTAADNLELFYDGTGYNAANSTIGTATVAGSVTGAVGSVTGAVGSVTGNVGGNVVGSVGSISGVTFPTNFADLSITVTTGRVDVAAIAGTAQTANDNGADINAILTDTNELQTDWADGGRLDLIIDGILADTADIQPKIGTPAVSLAADLAVVDGNVDDIETAIAAGVDVASIDGSTEAATNLKVSAETIVPGTAQTGTLSTTQMSTNLTEATDDHYNGRTIIWTSGVLQDQATDITDYDGASKVLTFTAVTEAPSNGDTFNIV